MVGIVHPLLSTVSVAFKEWVLSINAVTHRFPGLYQYSVPIWSDDRVPLRIMTAELHAAERINKAVLALDDDERQSLVVVVEQHLSKMRKGDFPPPDSGTGRNLSKGCARILAALL